MKIESFNDDKLSYSGPIIHNLKLAAHVLFELAVNVPFELAVHVLFELAVNVLF